jgi:hypothetical protein
MTPLTVDIREGAIAGLPQLMQDQRISSGGAVAVLFGQGPGDGVKHMLELGMPKASFFQVSSAQVEDAAELATHIRAQAFDALLAIGGGRTWYPHQRAWPTMELLHPWPFSRVAYTVVRTAYRFPSQWSSTWTLSERAPYA